VGKKVAWMYRRRGCECCQKALAILEQTGSTVADTTDADKVKYDRDAAIKLARSVKKVVTGRGKNVRVIDIEKDAPTDDALVAVLLGPWGNLKGPTLRVGDTLLVGFNQATYQKLFGV
jgi:arsenate reductase-like glutaredoxin family protein